jgi:hypothetical protein
MLESCITAWYTSFTCQWLNVKAAVSHQPLGSLHQNPTVFTTVYVCVRQHTLTFWHIAQPLSCYLMNLMAPIVGAQHVWRTTSCRMPFYARLAACI